MRLLITGGAGFIGSAACRYFIHKGYEICNVDKLTYAANINNLYTIQNHTRYHFVQEDICNARRIRDIVFSFKPSAILHLAAESHVDRSILDSSAFLQANVIGTTVLLNVAVEYRKSSDCPEEFRFHHVSTDEVYGDLAFGEGAFLETTPYNPSSPYSASKAASDFMVSSWHRTYGLPVVISNCSNNYGPFQNPEKLIPLTIVNALQGKSLPVYGDGLNVRDWLYVDDHIEALDKIMTHGSLGGRYNIGGCNEWRNIDVVQLICSILDKKQPRSDGKSYAEQVRFVSDRLGHDRRYAIDASKLKRELAWMPRHDFETGLKKTVEWYLENSWWWTGRNKTA